MKRLFLLTAITLVAMCGLSVSCGSSDSKKAEAPERQGWNAFPLYGDVESVIATNYELEEKFGEIVRGDIVRLSKYYFNAAGDVIEEARYYSDGSLYEKSIYKYDSAGNMIEETWYRGEALIPKSQTVYEITYRK